MANDAQVSMHLHVVVAFYIRSLHKKMEVGLEFEFEEEM